LLTAAAVVVIVAIAAPSTASDPVTSASLAASDDASIPSNPAPGVGQLAIRPAGQFESTLRVANRSRTASPYLAPSPITSPSNSAATPPPAPSLPPPAPATPPAAAPTPSYVLPAQGRYTSCFCERWGEMHGGIDLANANGTPELAAGAGTVIVAGPAGGFGQWVQLRHDDGTVTVYGHMDTIEVSVGQSVAAGQLIATMGAQGNSTGPHLHFEVWPAGDRAQRIDPALWLTERGVTLPEYTP
jgi:murein DD-endopeptidase MepM/ murein hydrolase activator NlpD